MKHTKRNLALLLSVSFTLGLLCGRLLIPGADVEAVVIETLADGEIDAADAVDLVQVVADELGDDDSGDDDSAE